MNNRTRHERFQKGSIGFLLTYAIPGLLVLSAELGRTTGQADAFAVLPLIVAFVVVPLVSAIRPGRAEPLPAHVASSATWQAYFRALPLPAVPAQLTALYFALDYWHSGMLSPWGGVGWLLSTGLFSALFAVSVGHELIHQKGRLDHILGGVLLSTVCFGTFKIVHLRVHHPFVGTPRDFATARRGHSLYRFWTQCLVGNVREALRCERERLQRLRQPLWRSELVAWYGLSGLWLGLALFLWGWTGGFFFLLQSLLAILNLDWTNYIQHYGLTRRMDPRGRYEAVRPHHAWSIDCRITNLALLNLLRHGDHHSHPLRPYQTLVRHDVPAYPYPFAIMYLLALVTPLFQRVVHPRLDRFEMSRQPTALTARA